MELGIDLHDYKEDGRVGRRFTERGIIRKGELYFFNNCVSFIGGIR